MRYICSKRDAELLAWIAAEDYYEPKLPPYPDDDIELNMLTSENIDYIIGNKSNEETLLKLKYEDEINEWVKRKRWELKFEFDSFMFENRHLKLIDKFASNGFEGMFPNYMVWKRIKKMEERIAEIDKKCTGILKAMTGVVGKQYVKRSSVLSIELPTEEVTNINKGDEL